MSKVLYSHSKQITQSYPRQDDEPIVGLDPDYLVLTQVETTPPSYNPSTQFLEQSWEVDESQLEYRQLWIIKELPLIPNWAGARSAIDASQILADWLPTIPLKDAMTISVYIGNASIDELTTKLAGLQLAGLIDATVKTEINSILAANNFAIQLP